MKILGNCFNFITTMLSYHIKFLNVFDTHVYFMYVYLTEATPRFLFVGGKGASDKSSLMNFP